MPKLAVATTKRGKLREIAELLRGLPFELVTLAEWPDVAAPEETGRTFAENARLKMQLAARDQAASGKTDEALPKSDSLKKGEPKVADGERKIEIPLPSDQDMDRMMSFLERAWRRLIDMANRVQKDVSGKI